MVEQAPRRTVPRSIVSITSVNAEIPSLNRGEYCISKAGASMLTRLFALRLAPHGIGVFEVRPGIIRTPMTAPVAERYEREIAPASPDRPVGRARRRRPRVATIATGQLPFSAGQVIYVDGGLSQGGFEAWRSASASAPRSVRDQADVDGNVASGGGGQQGQFGTAPASRDRRAADRAARATQLRRSAPARPDGLR